MTILEQDIKLLASRVMDDVPEGGGGPTGTVIPYGDSNAIFGDVTEVDRSNGDVSIRQIHLGVLTPNTDKFMDANLIVSRLPTDPNVSVTLAKCGLFARRSTIAQAIASYLIEGVQWSGFLLEDHVIGMRSIQIMHRPGTPAPDIGRVLVMIHGANVQFIRATDTTTELRTFTYASGGGYVDFQASVTKVDLTDTLRYAFPGSPPTREFVAAAGKTILRDTTVADAAEYYGASAISGTGTLGDLGLLVQSIYTQIVPSSRTETTAIDQRPAAARTLVLAESPRQVEVAVAAHAQRVKIGQSNRGFSYVGLLKPLPAPGTVIISFQALGNWYTLADNGAGEFEGSGSGRVNYSTGSFDYTLTAMPDDGSAIIVQWAERTAFTNRAAQAVAVRAPEYSWQLDDQGIVPASITIGYTSAGVVRTATVNAAGQIGGAGSGVVDAVSGVVFFKPQYMPDAGSQLDVHYDTDTLQREFLTPGAPDSAGIVALTLAQQPVPGTLAVSWVTARTVSETSGGTQTLGQALKGPRTTTETYTFDVSPVGVPADYVPVAAPPGNWEPQGIRVAASATI